MRQHAEEKSGSDTKTKSKIYPLQHLGFAERLAKSKAKRDNFSVVVKEMSRASKKAKVVKCKRKKATGRE